MNFLATIILLILSSIWYIISFKFITNEIGTVVSNNLNYSILLFLAGMFVFGVLFGKTLIKRKTDSEKKEYEEFLKYKNKKLSEELLNSNKNRNFLKEIKTLEDEKISIKKTYYNYEKDYEPIKKSIDIILDEREENYKHKINLKEEILKKDFKDFFEKENKIKDKFNIEINNTIDKKNINNRDTIIDNTFINVANNLKKQKKQDLKIIEGIGPKIEILLNNNGIYSYKDLANSEISKLKQILEKANKRYLKLHNPTTWPKQAEIANSGNFDKLKIYQEKLVKGVEIR